MLGFTASVHAARNDHTACSGCSLCLLVCPVWRRTRDVRLTPHGRAKALQHGAGVAEIAASIQSCTLCAACEPACPERIDLVGMIIDLRRQLARLAGPQGLQARMDAQLDECTARPRAPQPSSRRVLLPGRALRDCPEILSRVAALLRGAGRIAVGDDDGSDIALALEAGAAIASQRLERFLAPLRRAGRIIVADGLLLRQLRRWLPRVSITGLGEALSSLRAVRRGLRATDMYVIEPRAYHADYQRLVKYYDALRTAHGFAFNLDLQRVAIPATARSLPQRLGLEAPDDSGQARWILQGRKIARIVVESLEDRAAFEQAAFEQAMGSPVVHLAEVAEDGCG